MTQLREETYLLTKGAKGASGRACHWGPKTKVTGLFATCAGSRGPWTNYSFAGNLVSGHPLFTH